MKQYDITITETLQKTVTVEAESREQAESMVQTAWNNEDYVLGAENFVEMKLHTDAEREIEVQQDSMDVLLVEPNAYPKRITMGTGLEALQAAVGGDIEAIYPYEDVALIMNEEGKLNGMPLNRALRTDDGDVYDIIAGAFLVTGLTEDNFGSLSPELTDKYEQLFHQPEMFVKMGRSVMALPLPDDMVREKTEKPAKPEEIKAKPPDRDVL